MNPQTKSFIVRDCACCSDQPTVPPGCPACHGAGGFTRYRVADGAISQTPSAMHFCGEPTDDGDTAAEYLRAWYEANRETDRERKGKPWDRGIADNFMLGLMNEASRIESERRRQTGRSIDPDEFQAECLAHRLALNRAEAAEAKLVPLAASTSAGALIDVLAERRRQVEAEGFTTEHDDEHTDGDIARAAATYAMAGAMQTSYLRMHFLGEWANGGFSKVRSQWPDRWDWAWFKPTNPRRDLVKAAALILAEIERLDRADGTAALAPTAHPVPAGREEIKTAVDIVATVGSWATKLAKHGMVYQARPEDLGRLCDAILAARPVAEGDAGDQP